MISLLIVLWIISRQPDNYLHSIRVTALDDRHRFAAVYSVLADHVTVQVAYAFDRISFAI